MKGLEHLTCEERYVQPQEETTERGPHQCLQLSEVGGAQRSRLLSVVPSNRTRGNGWELMHKKFPLNKEELLYCTGE